MTTGKCCLHSVLLYAEHKITTFTAKQRQDDEAAGHQHVSDAALDGGAQWNYGHDRRDCPAVWERAGQHAEGQRVSETETEGDWENRGVNRYIALS